MQLDLFDVMYERFMFEKEKPIRVVELFSGIGFQTMGMKLAEIPHEVVATCEVDKFAVLSYASIHTDYLEIRDTYFEENEVTKDEMVETLQNKNVGWNFATQRHTITHSTNIETLRDYFLADKLINNLGDISLLKANDFPKDIDIMTYSFPCTDLSKAGQRKGLEGGTRSGLVYEVVRLLDELNEINNLPKVPIMENVVDLIQRNYIDSWNEIQFDIEKLGYTNYTFTMNGRNYGIAQNRDRVFMVSILGQYNYIEPKEFELKYRLKDYLEENVDESYYLSEKMFNYLNSDHPKHKRKDKFEKNQKPLDYKGWSNTITTRETNVVDSTFIKIPEATKKGWKEAKEGDGVYLNRAHQKRGVVQKGMIQTLKTTAGNDVGVVVKDDSGGIINPLKGKTNRGWHFEQEIYDDKGITRALKAGGGSGNIPKVVDNRFFSQALETLAENDVEYGDSISAYNKKVDRSGTSPTITTRPEGLKTAILPVTNDLRIRKLTPKETGRLMGMNDYQIKKQSKVTSNAQMYKQHGNGIIAQVIGLIIGSMYYLDYEELKETVLRNSFDWK